MTAYIWCKVYLVPDLKANMLWKTNNIILEQFVLNFYKKQPLLGAVCINSILI